MTRLEPFLHIIYTHSHVYYRFYVEVLGDQFVVRWQSDPIIDNRAAKLVLNKVPKFNYP